MMKGVPMWSYSIQSKSPSHRSIRDSSSSSTHSLERVQSNKIEATLAKGASTSPSPLKSTTVAFLSGLRKILTPSFSLSCSQGMSSATTLAAANIEIKKTRRSRNFFRLRLVEIDESIKLLLSGSVRTQFKNDVLAVGIDVFLQNAERNRA